MTTNEHNMDFVLREKQTELKLLELEMSDALRWEGNEDYEYAAQLDSTIRNLKREVEYYEHLAGLSAEARQTDFIVYLQQFLAGDYKSIHILVDIRSHNIISAPVIQIKKMKKRHWVVCIHVNNTKLGYYSTGNIGSDLVRLGWKRNQSNTKFHYKTRLKNPEEFASFHQLISKIMLDIFRHVWSVSDKQYYLFEK